MRKLTSMAILAATLGLLAGSVVNVGAQEEAAPQPPVEFSGRVVCGPEVSADRAGTEEVLEVGAEAMVLTRARDGAWRQSATVSDPRFEGDWYHTWEMDGYALPEAEGGPEVQAWTWRVENDEGAWQAQVIQATFPDGTPIGDPPAVFIGEGAYEGLTAIVASTEADVLPCGVDIRGVIFAGAPTPEPYVPE